MQWLLRIHWAGKVDSVTLTFCFSIPEVEIISTHIPNTHWGCWADRPHTHVQYSGKMPIGFVLDQASKRCIPTTRGKLVPRTKGLFQSQSLKTWTDQAWPCGTESSPLQTKGDAGKALEQAQHGVKEEHRVGIKMLKVYAVSFLLSFRGIQSCYQLCRKTYLVWWRKYLLKDVKAHKHSKKEHRTFTSPISWTNNLLRWDSQGETYSVVLFQVISFLSKPNK